MGVILFELLTGRPAFVADDDFSLIDMHVNSAPPSLCDLDPSLPRELDAVVQRALAKFPAQRYSSAAEMARAIEPAAQRLLP